MFYSYDILHPRSGKLSILWLVATGSFKYDKRQDKDFNKVINVNVPRSCSQILKHVQIKRTGDDEKPRHLSLYLSSMLMYGVVKIHERQVLLLYHEAVESKIRLCQNRILIDLPEHHIAAVLQSVEPCGPLLLAPCDVLPGAIELDPGNISPRKMAPGKGPLEYDSLRQLTSEKSSGMQTLQMLEEDWEHPAHVSGPHSVAHLDDITIREVDLRQVPVSLPAEIDFGPPFSELPEDWMRTGIRSAVPEITLTAPDVPAPDAPAPDAPAPDAPAPDAPAPDAPAPDAPAP
ncbi:meiotic recombination protein REC8 homolog [Hyalella azteca]|uniref:Meiotic recombination protein REC8 homolog n=1 Tax=Hyalella azteca TaxID=294128 RepID=A0A8B7PJK6_HYAAZ|nr:meiotic recombination protein REC8 homolog [Hyalella azteca]